MTALFAPLFQQFAGLEHPIRYSLLLFITILGALHLVNDLSIFVFDTEFIELARLFMWSVLLSVLIFISQYFRQKKLKRSPV